MSRHAQNEEERAHQLNVGFQEEENRIKAQRDRIYAPIVWRRLGSGIRIQDLQPPHYDQVLHIIEECYLPEEVLCRNSNMSEDPTSIKSFLDSMLYYLNDHSSIIAVDELLNNAVAGFLITKSFHFHKADYSSDLNRGMPVEGEAHKKYTAFVDLLNSKADVFTDFHCGVFLRYVLLCILPEYRRKGLGLELFLTAVDVARSLNIPVVMGIFSCWRLQKLAKKIGMKVVQEMYYVDWKDRFGELIFEEPGAGNYTCAVMAGEVPPPPEPEPPPAVDEKPEKSKKKDKRKQKGKKDKKKDKKNKKKKGA